MQDATSTGDPRLCHSAPACCFSFCVCVLSSCRLLAGRASGANTGRTAAGGALGRKAAAKQKLLERRPFDAVTLNQSRRRRHARSQTIKPAAATTRHTSQKRPAQSSRSRSAHRRIRNRLGQRRSKSRFRAVADGRGPATGRPRANSTKPTTISAACRTISELPRPRRRNFRIFATQRGRSYQAKQYDRALALLLSLYQRNPTYAGLPSSLEAVAGEIIQRYLREGNYAAARHVLDMWQTKFNGISQQAADRLAAAFRISCQRQLADASRLVSQKQYIPPAKP